MPELTTEGQRIANDLSIRHSFSLDAVSHMMHAVHCGNGTMAQFNHNEFAGGGQWMRGGMTMVSDMFNNSLKGRVDSLCDEIASILASSPNSFAQGSFQSQSQGGQTQQAQSAGSPASTPSPFFVPDPNQFWWPTEFGSPAATGAQNNVGYAYFPATRRLAVKTGDQIWVYDTLNHQIGGFSQQQGIDGSIAFTSQFGTVNLAALPVIIKNGTRVAQHQATEEPASGQSPESLSTEPQGSHETLDAIERLAELHARGILTDHEFAIKKEQLLSRL